MATGKKTGGRQKGSLNKSTEAAKAVALVIAASGLSPLDYLLGVMRDDTAPKDMRQDAAKAAAPYVHPKLASVEVTGKDGGPIATDNVNHQPLPVSETAAFLASALRTREVATPPKSRQN